MELLKLAQKFITKLAIINLKEQVYQEITKILQDYTDEVKFDDNAHFDLLEARFNVSFNFKSEFEPFYNVQPSDIEDFIIKVLSDKFKLNVYSQYNCFNEYCNLNIILQSGKINLIINTILEAFEDYDRCHVKFNHDHTGVIVTVEDGSFIERDIVAHTIKYLFETLSKNNILVEMNQDIAIIKDKYQSSVLFELNLLSV